MTLEPLKLVHHGFVRVGLSMVERVVSIAVCQVESVEVGAARERNVDQLLRMRPGIPVHDRGVRSPLRLVHRDGAGLDEGKLRSLAGNAGLAVYGEREGLHFDGYPGDALDDVAVGLGLLHGVIRAPCTSNSSQRGLARLSPPPPSSPPCSNSHMRKTPMAPLTKPSTASMLEVIM